MQGVRRQRGDGLASLSFSLEVYNYLSFKIEMHGVFRFSSAIWQLEFGHVGHLLKKKKRCVLFEM